MPVHVDWRAIRTAIAAQCALGTGIASATAAADSLTEIGDLPAVKVIAVNDITINDSSGGRVGANSESREAEITGVLLVDTSAGNGYGLWLAEPLVEQMFSVVRTTYGLGLDYIQDVWLESARLGEVDYMGETFIGAVLTWRVRVRQTDIVRTA